MARRKSIFAKTATVVLSLLTAATITKAEVERSSHRRDTAAASPASAQQDSQSQVPTDEPRLEPADDEKGIADLSVEELMQVQVVVTASRREQKITTVPYAISVLTAADIRAAGARSVPDALRLVPGVDVAELSYSNYAVSPRGFHGFLGRQVLVLVDGRQIFDSHFGGNLWGSWPFLLEDIERIEVIRGPGGVTWGANAVNGVINIITKDPADQLGLTIVARGGSRGTHKEYMGYAFQDGNLRLRISTEYEASDGFLKGGSILGRLEDDYKTGRISIYGIYESGPDDTFTFSAGSAVVDGGFPKTPLGGFGLRRNPGSQASFLMGKWSHRISKDNRFDLTGYVNDSYGAPGVPQIDYRYQQFALQFSQTFVPHQDHTLTWGVDTRFDLLDGGNSDPQMLSRGFLSTGIVGAYLRDQWRFAPKWTLDLGARLDYEFYGGVQPSARASLAYEVTDASFLYGSVSHAFQMPPVGLRFLEMPMLNGLSWAVGDRDADAETLMAYELGYRGRFFDRLDLSLNLFWNNYDRLTTLSPRLGPPGLLTLDFRNRASATLYGVEFGASYAAAKNLTLMANYTFQHLDWRASVPFHDKDLMSPPRHKAMVGARYSPTSDLHLSGQLYFVGSTKAPRADFPFVARSIDPYPRLDLRGEYEFRDDNASIAVGVRNLLDDHHPEGGTLFLNYAETPRMVFVEFRMRIK
jgi:iron complex outermembrane receptor protein